MTTDQLIARADFFFITEGTEHTESIQKNKKQFSLRALCSRWCKKVVSR
jgi:hypothetical protein